MKSAAAPSCSHSAAAACATSLGGVARPSSCDGSIAMPPSASLRGNHARKQLRLPHLDQMVRHVRELRQRPHLYLHRGRQPRVGLLHRGKPGTAHLPLRCRKLIRMAPEGRCVEGLLEHGRREQLVTRAGSGRLFARRLARR
eukprot:scaffold16219_cov102-Isochrysis_galbana.AAC.24